MEIIKKRISVNLANLRETAIWLGKWWVKKEIAGYSNPSRRGLKKGSSIGFPRSKKIAALASFLYPNLLSVADIAKLAGTSRGTVDVWRTQKEFRRVAREASLSFGRMIANSLEYAIENPESGPVQEHDLIDLKTFYEGAGQIQFSTVGGKDLSLFLLQMISEFDEHVFEPFQEMIFKKADGKFRMVYLTFFDRVIQRKRERLSKEARALGMHDLADKAANFVHSPFHLSLQRAIAEYYLHIIQKVMPGGKSQRNLYQRQIIQDCVSFLRNLIGNLVSDLAGGKLPAENKGEPNDKR
jgi:hypothetical protein